jgi:hypothetical protein
MGSLGHTRSYSVLWYIVVLCSRDAKISTLNVFMLKVFMLKVVVAYVAVVEHGNTLLKKSMVEQRISTSLAQCIDWRLRVVPLLQYFWHAHEISYKFGLRMNMTCHWS